MKLTIILVFVAIATSSASGRERRSILGYFMGSPALHPASTEGSSPPLPSPMPTMSKNDNTTVTVQNASDFMGAPSRMFGGNFSIIEQALNALNNNVSDDNDMVEKRSSDSSIHGMNLNGLNLNRTMFDSFSSSTPSSAAENMSTLFPSSSTASPAENVSTLFPTIFPPIATLAPLNLSSLFAGFPALMPNLTAHKQAPRYRRQAVPATPSPSTFAAPSSTIVSEGTTEAPTSTVAAEGLTEASASTAAPARAPSRVPVTFTITNGSAVAGSLSSANAAQSVVVNILVGRDGADNSTQLIVNGTEMTSSGPRPVHVRPGLAYAPNFRPSSNLRPVYYTPHQVQPAHGQFVPPYSAPVLRNQRKPADC